MATSGGHIGKVHGCYQQLHQLHHLLCGGEEIQECSSNQIAYQIKSSSNLAKERLKQDITKIDPVNISRDFKKAPHTKNKVINIVIQ